MSSPRRHLPVLEHFLFHEPPGALDRYQSLLDEDQALRDAEYKHPDPRRRRLRVSCNECSRPACCNQRVEMDFVEALALYRHAAAHAPRELGEALERGRRLHAGKPLDDAEFFQRRIPCPFLVRGRCTVYAARPHACRTHYMGGNPSKCARELAPSETYAMDPDGGLIGELEKIGEDVAFDALIEGVAPREMSELLHFIERISALPRWRQLTTLDWRWIERGPDEPRGR